MVTLHLTVWIWTSPSPPQVFAEPLSVRLEKFESSLLEYYDALGLVIIIRIVHLNKVGRGVRVWDATPQHHH